MRAFILTLSFGILHPFISSAAFAVESQPANPRSGKKAWLGVEPVGLTMAISKGLRGAYFIKPDLAVEAALGSATYKIGEMKGEKLLVEGKGKYYLGNSFYADGGLTFEQWKADALADSNLQKIAGTATNVGVSFHIGNQWVYDNNLTVGCDWIGYFAALSSGVELDGTTGLNSGEIAKEKDDFASNFGGGSVHLTRFYAGYVF